jgi:hypothetical protein
MSSHTQIVIVIITADLHRCAELSPLHKLAATIPQYNTSQSVQHAHRRGCAAGVLQLQRLPKQTLCC